MFDVEKKNLQKTIEEADKKISAIKEEKVLAQRTLRRLESIEKDLTSKKEQPTQDLQG